jgi:hypothetical protein
MAEDKHQAMPDANHVQVQCNGIDKIYLQRMLYPPPLLPILVTRNQSKHEASSLIH